MKKMEENDNNEAEKRMLENDDPRNTKTSNISKYLSWISIICSILAIIISIVCIGLIASVDTEESFEENHFEPICVECKNFDACKSKQFTIWMNQLQKQHDENGTEQCCAHNETQLEALITLVLSRRACIGIELPPVVNPTNFSMSKFSVHKSLVPSTSYDENVEYPIFRTYPYNLAFATDENKPLLEHNRGIELLDSGTKITHSGFYFVYCSIHFKPDSAEKCEKFASKIWSMTIKRTRSSDENFSGPILTAKHTCCDSCVRNQETSYTAGVFELKRNDFLSMDVSGEGLVSYKPQSTFFGLAMLWSSED